MPNVWTHFIWGEEVLRRLQLSEAVLGSSRNEALFRFGCQGPDLLFYHRFYPWMKTKAAFANELGSMLHKRRCGAFLRALLQQCEGSGLHERKAAYVLGFIAHHVLDRSAHPFVFARQGSARRDHQRLEVELDTLVAQRVRQIDTRVTPVAPYLDSGAALPVEVSNALTAALECAYPPEWADRAGAQLWNESYRDMLAAMRLFHDPYKVKQKLLGGAIEPFVPGRKDAAADAANESRQQWRHPVHTDTISQDTFWDIWDRSLADGERVLGAAAAWLRAPSQAAWNDFAETLGDLSYETGLTSDP